MAQRIGMQPLHGVGAVGQHGTLVDGAFVGDFAPVVENVGQIDPRFGERRFEFEGAARLGPVSRMLKRHIVALPIPAATTRVDWLAGASVLGAIAVFTLTSVTERMPSG